MAKLRLFITLPGNAHTYIPVRVDSADLIGSCISSLVNRLGFPRRDAQGRERIYVLRPLTSPHPLPNTMRFADAQVLSETRLVLEGGKADVVARPVGALSRGSGPASVPGGGSSPQMVNRRSFLIGGILAGCAGSGFFTGIATAFATRGHPVPITMMPTRQPMLLQHSLLFSQHQHTVRALAWSPDGAILASGADDGWLLIWTPDGQVQQRIPHPAGVAALAWSPTGQQLASGSGTSVRFFDGHTAVPLAPARKVHTGQVTSLAWSKSVGSLLVSGSLDQRAIVWETQDFQPQAIFTRHTAAIDALSSQPDSPIIASASQGGVVRVWDVDTLAELHGWYQDAPIPMRAVAFAPTGQQLTAGGNDGQVRLWNNGLICQQTALTAQGIQCADVPLRFGVSSAPVRSLAWSPDARFLATGDENGTLAIWSMPQGEQPTVVTKTPSANPIEAIAWSPARSQIAVASDKNVIVWNMQGET